MIFVGLKRSSHWHPCSCRNILPDLFFSIHRRKAGSENLRCPAAVANPSSEEYDGKYNTEHEHQQNDQNTIKG
jgi:hypothetical protein